MRTGDAAQQSCPVTSTLPMRNSFGPICITLHFSKSCCSFSHPAQMTDSLCLPTQPNLNLLVRLWSRTPTIKCKALASWNTGQEVEQILWKYHYTLGFSSHFPRQLLWPLTQNTGLDTPWSNLAQLLLSLNPSLVHPCTQFLCVQPVTVLSSNLLPYQPHPQMKHDLKQQSQTSPCWPHANSNFF